MNKILKQLIFLTASVLFLNISPTINKTNISAAEVSCQSEITNSNEEEAILKINEGLDTLNKDGYIEEYYILGQSINSSLQTPLRQAIKIAKGIKGEYLTKDEILKIVSEMTDTSNEDAAWIVAQITARIGDNNNLTSEEIQAIVDNVISDRQTSAYNIVEFGNGSVSDYEFLGQKGVTEDNLQCINKDILLNHTVTTTNINYLKNSELNNAVDYGIAIYNINQGNFTINKSSGKINEFSTLGLDVDFSLEKPLKQAITLAKGYYEGYLTRSDISTTLISVTNHEDTPWILQQITDMIDTNTNLTKETVISLYTSVVNDRHSALDRIAAGNGTVSDYEFLGQTEVTEDNLQSINKYITSDYSLLTKMADHPTFKNSYLTDAMPSALMLYRINEGLDTIDETTGYINEYYSLLDLKIDSSYQSLLQEAIKIAIQSNGSCLGQSEILNLANKITQNEDSKLLLQHINDKLGDTSRLTSLEIQSIINDVITYREDALNRIVNGKGTVEDFNFFGKTEVNTDNLDYLNEDIKLNFTVSPDIETSFSYRYLDYAVKAGLDIYSINSDNYTINEETGYINEYSSLNVNATSSLQNTLIQGMRIARKIKGSSLTRSEIIDIVLRIEDFSDSGWIIEQITNKIGDNTNLTSEETQSIVDDILNYRYEATSRILEGNGTVEDFHFLGQTVVNDNNLECINTDIKLNKTVILNDATLFLNSYLDNAVNLGLAIYNINKGNYTTDETTGCIKEFNLIDFQLNSSFQSKVKFYIHAYQCINNSNYLTRDEILKIAYNTVNETWNNNGELDI